MALTLKGKRTGSAGASDLADQREMIYEAQEQERRRQYTEKMNAECKQLYTETFERFGKPFEDWYDSDAVPEFGPASERIRLIKEWIATQEAPSFLEGVTAPVLGYVQGGRGENRIAWRKPDEIDPQDRELYERLTTPRERFEKVTKTAPEGTETV